MHVHAHTRTQAGMSVHVHKREHGHLSSFITKSQSVENLLGYSSSQVCFSMFS